MAYGVTCRDRSSANLSQVNDAETPTRRGTLLVPVSGLSGTVYPVGTTVTLRGAGASVDGFVAGDWLPLHWWEFTEPHNRLK